MTIKFKNLEDGLCKCPPCGGISCNVKIADYSDGFFEACSSCDDDGEDPPWDGTFTSSSPPHCGSKGASPSVFWSISGKLEGGNGMADILDSSFGGDEETPAYSDFELHIFCHDEGLPGNRLIWAGDKIGGPEEDITGVYARFDGCDTTPTLTIVPCESPGCSGEPP